MALRRELMIIGGIMAGIGLAIGGAVLQSKMHQERSHRAEDGGAAAQDNTPVPADAGAAATNQAPAKVADAAPAAAPVRPRNMRGFAWTELRPASEGNPRGRGRNVNADRPKRPVEEPLALEGHTGLVWGLAISRDGKFLASGGSDHTVRIWDLSTWKEVTKLTQAQWVIKDLAFSADGKKVAAAEDGPLAQVWEIATKTRVDLRVKGGHQSHVAFTPDGKEVVLSLMAGKVEKWDLQTQTMSKEIEVSGGFTLTSMALGVDGKRVLVGAMDGKAEIIDLESGETVWELPNITDRVVAVSWGDQDKLAIVHQLDEKAVMGGETHVYDVENKQEIQTFKDWGAQSAITPDGKFEAMTRGDHVAVWSPRDGKMIGEYHGFNSEVGAVAITPDGRYAIESGGSDPSEADTAREGNDSRILVWDTQDPTHFLKAKPGAAVAEGPPPKRPTSIAPDCKLAASIGDDGIKITDIGASKMVRTLAGKGATAVAFGENNLVAAALPVGQIKVWDATDGTEKASASIGTSTAPVTMMAWAGAVRLVVAKDAELEVWDTSGTEMKSLGAVDGKISCLAVDDAGKYALCGTEAGAAVIYDLASMTELRRLERPKLSKVTMAALLPEQNEAIIRDVTYGTVAFALDSGEPLQRYMQTEMVATGRPFEVISRDDNDMPFMFRLDQRDVDAQRFAGWLPAVWAARLTPDGKFMVLIGGEGVGRLAPVEKQVRLARESEMGVDSTGTVGVGYGETTEKEERGTLHTVEGLQLWNMEDGTKTKFIPVPGLRFLRFENTNQVLAFSADGKQVAVADSERGAAVVADVDKREVTQNLKAAAKGIDFVAFSPDGRMIAAGGPARDGKGTSTFNIWDIQSGQQKARLKQTDLELCGAEWSPDSKQVMIRTHEANTPGPPAQPYAAAVWDVGSEQVVKAFILKTRNFVEAGWTRDGAELLMVEASGKISLLDAKTYALKQTVALPEEEPDRTKRLPDSNIRWAKLSPDGKWLMMAGPNKQRMVDVKSLQLVAEWPGFHVERCSFYFRGDMPVAGFSMNGIDREVELPWTAGQMLASTGVAGAAKPLHVSAAAATEMAREVASSPKTIVWPNVAEAPVNVVPKELKKLAAAADDPHATQDNREAFEEHLLEMIRQTAPAIHKSREAANLAWNKAMYPFVYDTYGLRDPKWDSLVHQFLAAYFAPKPEQIKIAYWKNLEQLSQKAIDAGCGDPLVLELHEAARSRIPGFDRQKEHEQLIEAAGRYEISAYPAYFKFDAYRNAATALEGSNLSNSDIASIVYWSNAAFEIWPDAVNTPGISTMTATDKCLPLFNVVERMNMRWDEVRDKVIGPYDERFAHGETSSQFLLAVTQYLEAKEEGGVGFPLNMPGQAEAWARPHTDAAYQMMQAAWLENPYAATHAIHMMDYIAAHNLNRQELEKWYKRGLAAEPNNFDLHWKWLTYLDEAYGGSYQQMIDYGRDCLSEGNWASRVPYILARVHYLLYLHNGSDPAYLAKPTVWRDIQTVYTGLLNYDPDNLSDHQNYFGVAVTAGKWSIAKEQLKFLGDKPDTTPFGGDEAFEKMKEKVVKNAGGSGQ